MIAAKQKITPRKKTRVAWAALLFLLVFGVTAAQVPIDGLKDTISEKQQQLKAINDEIFNIQQQINKVKQETATLKNEIALFDLNIRQMEIQIGAVQLQIDTANHMIAETEASIAEKEAQIEKQKVFLGETLRLLNEYDSKSALEITLANNTFSEFLDEVQYATNLQEKTQEILSEIKTLKIQLEAKKMDLVNQLAKAEELKHSLDIAQGSLEEQRAQKQEVLLATRGQEKIYQSLLADASAKQDQVEREITDIEYTIRRQLGDKSLPAISGVLRWPMSGILTQGYGKTGFTALGYSFHNGLDIGAPAGTLVYAAGDGEVYATGTGQAAYGNWVVIRHAVKKDGQTFGIYTLYGHLRKLTVTPGKLVKSGDLIGYEGNTGNTTRLLYGPERGYHLHFTVFDEDGFGIKDGAYQSTYGSYQIPYGYTYNPLDFLR